MKKYWWAWIVVILFVCGGYVMSISNSLASKQQDIEAQQGQIQTVLQRRADLIPNIVASVKGSQGQESKVYGEIAEARTQYYNANKSYDKATTTDEKTSSLAKQDSAMNIMIGSIKENYPDLKSNDQMSKLIVQLEGSENRISMERQKYNTTVKVYNNKVVRFPTSMVAGMLGKHTYQYYQADSTSQSVPAVNFK